MLAVSWHLEVLGGLWGCLCHASALHRGSGSKRPASPLNVFAFQLQLQAAGNIGAPAPCLQLLCPAQALSCFQQPGI